VALLLDSCGVFSVWWDFYATSARKGAFSLILAHREQFLGRREKPVILLGSNFILKFSINQNTPGYEKEKQN